MSKSLRMGQKEPPRPGSTFYCGQEWAGQKKPPKSDSTIWYGREWARKTHPDPLVRFITSKIGPERTTTTWKYDFTAKSGPERITKTRQNNLLARFATVKSGPERATQTRQYFLFRPRVGQKKPARPGDYNQEWTRKSPLNPAKRYVTAKNGPESVSKTR